jgi:nucleotide-binding universal stress UspA family protein
MMWDLKPRRILVGVEDSDCAAALSYAARESRLRGCGVHLVHVVPMVVGGPNTPDALVMVNGELHDLGRRIVGAAATTLEHLIDDDERPVSTEICHGPVAATLIEESANAALVILQHRGMGPDGHPPVLSVTSRVATHAHAPVIAVPAGWSEPDPGMKRVVTVGIGDGSESGRLVEVAADEAARLGATLRIVHAEDDAELDEIVDEVLPGPNEYVVSDDEPSDALLAQVEDTSLFVVGRRRPRLPLGRHLGPAVRSLLRLSPVPVMVVGPAEEDDSDHRDLATAVVP